MRVAVAAVLALAMTTSACFPNNAKHRTIAKLTEGGLMVGGIVTLAIVNTTADCDADEMIGHEDEADSCRTKSNVISAIGLGAILIGLVGFIVTISTEPDEVEATSTVTPTETTTKVPPPTPVATPPVTPPVSEPATPATP